MASQIDITIAPDGSAIIHTATILYDLFEDYRYFEQEAEKIDRIRDPLLYKRMARASILAFHGYIDGVLIRWIELIDPDLEVRRDLGSKIEALRNAIQIRSKTRQREMPDLQLASRTLRNKISHLKLSDKDTDITDELLTGQFFHDAGQALNWLSIAAHRLGLDMHNDPKKIMKPYIEVLGQSSDPSMIPLSDEDEELVRIAEMTFLELDAREAVDGGS